MRKIVLCVAAGMLVCCGELCEGKSVFAIASHGNGKIKAYEINGNNIDYQATIGETENFGGGAGGLCLWPLVDRMFVTYEGSTIITWASIKNLRRNPQTDEYTTGITGGNGLGGMAVDGSLYVISRDTSRLYAFAYDTYENTLIPVPLDVGHVYQELEDITTGIDIAIDETGSSIMGLPVGRLYVSDLSETVRYYNMATWQKEGSVTLDRSAIGIGLDKTRGYLYSGYFDGGGGSNYLMRYDLDGDPNDSETYLEKNLGAPVMDIAVDEDTGYLYLTLKRLHDGLTGIVEVYDPTNWISTDADSLVLLDTESDSDFVSEGPGGIAVGPAYKPPRFFVEKVDDVNELSESVLPGDEITYTIAVRPGVLDETNVVVTDFLPPGVDFVSADPNDGYYDADAHAYVWELGYLPGYDPNTWTGGDPNVYLALTVQVNDWAEPATDLINIVQTESDEAYTEAKALTPVGCWGGDIIYVDVDAVYEFGEFGDFFWEKGRNTGTSWSDAYRDLQDALARARKGCGNEIWVAEGTYKPSDNDVTVSFDMVPDAGIYGGFNATETQRGQRNWKIYDSILSGYYDDYNQSDKIVTGVGYLGDAVLDGFTITLGKTGIYCENTWDPNDLHEPNFVNCTIFDNDDYGIQFYDYADALIDNCIIIGNQGDGFNLDENCWPVIENCIIRDNYGKGILCADSHLEMTDSTIEDNNNDGLFFSGSVSGIYSCCITGNKNGIYAELSTVAVENSIIKNSVDNGVKNAAYNDLVLKNCIIYLNDDHGIYCSENSEVAHIYNNWIHHNGLDGINTSDTNEYADIRNNTVVYNDGYGIACDNGREPDVSNCIIWGNASGDVYSNSPVYSCFDNGTSGTGNIAVDPNFAYSNPDLYNYHLSADSDCIDAGDNTDVEIDETDIDGDDRIYDGDVDMGADEYACSDVYNELDFNGDGLVNMKDFTPFSQSWQSRDPNDPGMTDPNDSVNWDRRCNLDTSGASEYYIDLADLAIFAPEWLWQACWRDGGMWQAIGAPGGMMESMAAGSLAMPLQTTTIEPQPMDPQEMLDLLNAIWQEDLKHAGSIDKKAWKDFIDAVEKSLFGSQQDL